MSILTLVLMMLLLLLVTLIFFVNAVNAAADVDHVGNSFLQFLAFGIIAVQGRTIYLSMNNFVNFFILLYLSINASFHVGIAGC